MLGGDADAESYDEMSREEFVDKKGWKKLVV
jgi:hypothetical protein